MEISSELINTLKKANHVCVFTGAGISAESGIPTFRGEDGIWKKFRPEELASMEAFLSRPELVLEWYEMRRKIVEECEPNPGHRSIVTMAEKVPELTLITQNVDGLHQRAGSQNVLELHGNIKRSFCIQCKKEYGDILTQISDLLEKKSLPTCEACGGIIRPDIVWFGEMLPLGVFEQAERAARACDVFLSIGTSAQVYPAAGLILDAKESGAYVVEVNPEASELSSASNAHLNENAGIAMPKLLASLNWD